MDLFDETLPTIPAKTEKKPKKPTTTAKTYTPMEAFVEEATRLAMEKDGVKEVLEVKLINSSVGWVKYLRGKEAVEDFVYLGLPIKWCPKYGITPKTRPNPKK